MERLRIDAYLCPVMPLQTEAGRLLDSFKDGWADHLPAYAQDRIVDGLNSMAHMDIVLFNDHLNALLRYYGVVVTNIEDPECEIAFSYNEAGDLSEATSTAIDLRDVVRIAAQATFHGSELHAKRYVLGALKAHPRCYAA